MTVDIISAFQPQDLGLKPWLFLEMNICVEFLFGKIELALIVNEIMKRKTRFCFELTCDGLTLHGNGVKHSCRFKIWDKCRLHGPSDWRIRENKDLPFHNLNVFFVGKSLILIQCFKIRDKCRLHGPSGCRIKENKDLPFYNSNVFLVGKSLVQIQCFKVTITYE